MGGQVQTSASVSQWLLSPPLLKEDLSSGRAYRLDRPMLLCRSPGTCCVSYIGTDLLLSRTGPWEENDQVVVRGQGAPRHRSPFFGSNSLANPFSNSNGGTTFKGKGLG